MTVHAAYPKVAAIAAVVAVSDSLPTGTCTDVATKSYMMGDARRSGSEEANRPEEEFGLKMNEQL